MCPTADSVPEMDGQPQAHDQRVSARSKHLGALGAIVLAIACVLLGLCIGGFLTWQTWFVPLIDQSFVLAQRQEVLDAEIQRLEGAAQVQAQESIRQTEAVERLEVRLTEELAARQAVELDLASIKKERDQLQERLLALEIPVEPPSPPKVFQNTIGVQFKLLPSGSFVMGNDRDGPLHEVKLTNPFYLSLMEITTEQWNHVMGPNGAGGEAGRPIAGISWEQAFEFCRRLNALPAEHQAGRVYRLPTEAEWEYACRGGTKSEYSFGNTSEGLDEYGWFNESVAATPQPVGLLRPNPWGFYDMHGNVGEWCQDWFAPYDAGNAAQDPRGPKNGHRRIWRGGTYLSPPTDCTASRRGRLEPTDARTGLGIRLALDLPGRGDALKPADREPAETNAAEIDGMPRPGVVVIHNAMGMELRQVPAGGFEMGDGNGTKRNPDSHPVIITAPFFLGVYEVTIEQWERVMEASGPGKDRMPDLPVAGVTWNEATDFCKKLSEHPLEKAVGRRYRLPTEAEWEYACRAGTVTRFCFGNDPRILQDHGWCHLNAQGNRRPIGYKKPNIWGFYDMHGNVSEWCRDIWAELPRTKRTDPQGPPTGPLRVYRGGSWADEESHCESTHREGGRPNVSLDGILGFRVAMDLGTPVRSREKRTKNVLSEVGN